MYAASMSARWRSQVARVGGFAAQIGTSAKPSSLDHHVGAGKQRRWHGEAERLGCQLRVWWRTGATRLTRDNATRASVRHADRDDRRLVADLAYRPCADCAKTHHVTLGSGSSERHRRAR